MDIPLPGEFPPGDIPFPDSIPLPPVPSDDNIPPFPPPPSSDSAIPAPPPPEDDEEEIPFLPHSRSRSPASAAPLPPPMESSVSPRPPPPGLLESPVLAGPPPRMGPQLSPRKEPYQGPQNESRPFLPSFAPGSGVLGKSPRSLLGPAPPSEFGGSQPNFSLMSSSHPSFPPPMDDVDVLFQPPKHKDTPDTYSPFSPSRVRI